MFSPWNLNVSPLARRCLAADGHPVPDSPACPTGDELVDPTSNPSPASPNSPAPSIPASKSSAARAGASQALPRLQDPPRSAFPFRILARNAEGVEAEHDADIVIDATGVYGNPRASRRGRPPGSRRRRPPRRHRPRTPRHPRRPQAALRRPPRPPHRRRLQRRHIPRRPPSPPRRSPRYRNPLGLPLERPRAPARTRDPLPERARLARLANEVARTPAAGLRFIGRPNRPGHPPP
jgi:hypothetical protein